MNYPVTAGQAVVMALAMCLIVEAQSAPAGQQFSREVARAREAVRLAEQQGSSALPDLLAFLRDDSWYVRGEAIRVIVALGDASAGEHISPLLNDEHWYVREAALAGLLRLGASSAATLHGLDSPDPFVRARAALLAARLKLVDAVNPITALLSDGEAVVRRAAALSLGEMEVRGSAAALTALLNDQDSSVRTAAAQALGRIRARGARDALNGQLASAGEDDWIIAAALYRIGDHRHLDLITGALRSRYKGTSTSAFNYLIEFADPRSLGALAEFAGLNGRGGSANAPLDPGDAFTVKLALLEALPRFGSPEARELVERYLSDSDDRVRAAAAGSIGGFATGDSSGRILELLVRVIERETSPTVLEAANRSLRVFDSGAVAEAFLDRRQDASGPRGGVVKALAAAGVTTDALMRDLKDGPAPKQILAASRLGKLRDPAAVPALIGALETDSIELKVAVIRSLGMLGDRRAVDGLTAQSRAGHPRVREAAVTALGEVGDHTATEALLESVRDDMPGVRDASLRSLARLGISVEKLAQDISSNNWQIRLNAVSSLSRLGDRSAVPVVISALRDPELRVRAEAARALGAFEDGRAIDPLISALNDPSTEVRAEAAFSLGGFRDARAMSSLAALMNDRSPAVGLAAAESLARMRDPRATRVLTRSLSNEDWRIRSQAARVLARVAGEADLGEAVPLLAAALRDSDPVVRYYASEAMLAAGTSAVSHIIQIVRGGTESEQDRAARLLGRIGTPAIDPLIRLLGERDTSARTRAVVARTIGAIGDSRGIEPLLALLKDDRYFVRQQAAWALGQLGEAALDPLLTMASSSVPATRIAAVEALGWTGRPQAVDRLSEALSDPNANVRAAAVKALGETSNARAVPPLMAIVRDESSTQRSLAASALARLGTHAEPALVEGLRDAKPSVRALSAEALGEVGSPEVVDALIATVNSDRSGARGEAITALGKIGDARAVEPLGHAYRDGSTSVRKRAVVALSRFRDRRAVETLSIALADSGEEVRGAAAQGLGEVGDAAVIPLLERTADSDPSGEVRAVAARAIEQLRKRVERPSTN